MKIILTNDDGFGAPGLEALLVATQGHADPVILAPETAQSGVGHQVTTHAPITVRRRAENYYSVGGTPADCVRLGIKMIAPEASWVIAGINPGANLGSDLYQSGTVAAAREAAILGRRAVAISQYVSRGGTIEWEHTREHALRMISRLFGEDLSPGEYWNVNLPHPLNGSEPLDYAVCPLDRHAHDYSYVKDGDAYRYQGIIHERPRDVGGDVDVCLGGRIAVTKLAI